MALLKIAMRIGDGTVCRISMTPERTVGEWAVHKRVKWCARTNRVVEAMDHSAPWCITLMTNGMRAHSTRLRIDAMRFAQQVHALFPKGYLAGLDEHRMQLTALKERFR